MYLAFLEKRFANNMEPVCGSNRISSEYSEEYCDEYYNKNEAIRTKAFDWLDCFGKNNETYTNLFKQAAPGYNYTIPELGQGVFLCLTKIIDVNSNISKSVYVFVKEQVINERFYVTRNMLGVFLGKSQVASRELLELLSETYTIINTNPESIKSFVTIIDLPTDTASDAKMEGVNTEITKSIIQDVIEDLYTNTELEEPVSKQEELEVYKEEATELLASSETTGNVSNEGNLEEGENIKNHVEIVYNWINETLASKLPEKDYKELTREVTPQHFKTILEQAIKSKLNYDAKQLNHWYSQGNSEPVQAELIKMPDPEIMNGATAPSLPFNENFTNLEMGLERVSNNTSAKAPRLNLNSPNLERGPNTSAKAQQLNNRGLNVVGGNRGRFTRKRKFVGKSKRSRKMKGGRPWWNIAGHIRNTGEGITGLFKSWLYRTGYSEFADVYEQAIFAVKEQNRDKYEEEVKKFTRIINIRGDTNINGAKLEVKGFDISSVLSYFGPLTANLIKTGVAIGASTAAILNAAAALGSPAAGGALALSMTNPVTGPIIIGTLGGLVMYSTANFVIGANRALLQHKVALEAVKTLGSTEREFASTQEHIKSEAFSGQLTVLNGLQQSNKNAAIKWGMIISGIYASAVAKHIHTQITSNASKPTANNASKPTAKKEVVRECNGPFLSVIEL